MTFRSMKRSGHKAFFNRFAVHVAGNYTYKEKFSIVPNVLMYGGYEPNTWYRDIAAFPTRLSNEVTMVVTNILDGFVIEGRVVMSAENHTVSNCLFIQQGDEDYSAIEIGNDNKNFTITNNAFAGYKNAIDIGSGSSGEISNNVFWALDELEGGQIKLGSEDITVKVINNIFENVYPAVLWNVITIDENNPLSKPLIFRHNRISNSTNNENARLFTIFWSDGQIPFHMHYKLTTGWSGSEPPSNLEDRVIMKGAEIDCEDWAIINNNLFVNSQYLTDSPETISSFIPDPGGDYSLEELVDQGEPAAKYNDRHWNLNEGSTVPNTLRNDIGITGGPLAWFRTPDVESIAGVGHDEPIMNFTLPRPKNVHYDVEGTWREITWTTPVLLQESPELAERLLGYYVIRGYPETPASKSFLVDYAAHGSLAKGKRFFEGDPWGQGKVVAFVMGQHASPYEIEDLVPDPSKYYAYMVVAVYSGEHPGDPWEYSFWNTKRQIVVEKQVVFPGSKLMMIDPSRTFDFNDLEDGIRFEGQITQIEGENSNSHSIRINYPKTTVEEVEVEGEIIEVDVPRIHVENVPYRCSIILGEYIPSLWELVSNNWSLLTTPFWKIGLDNGGIYQGDIKEIRSDGQNPLRIQMDLKKEMQICNPDLQLGRLRETTFIESNPVPIMISPQHFNENEYEGQIIRLAVPRYRKDLTDYPSEIDVKMVSLDSDHHKIELPSPHDVMVKCFLELIIQPELCTEDTIVYMTDPTQSIIFVTDFDSYHDRYSNRLLYIIKYGAITFEIGGEE